jgi:hypothetical protein
VIISLAILRRIENDILFDEMQ